MGLILVRVEVDRRAELALGDVEPTEIPRVGLGKEHDDGRLGGSGPFLHRVPQGRVKRERRPLLRREAPEISLLLLFLRDDEGGLASVFDQRIPQVGAFLQIVPVLPRRLDLVGIEHRVNNATAPAFLVRPEELKKPRHAVSLHFGQDPGAAHLPDKILYRRHKCRLLILRRIRSVGHIHDRLHSFEVLVVLPHEHGKIQR